MGIVETEAAPSPVLDESTGKLETCKLCGGGTSNRDLVFGHVCAADSGAGEVAPCAA